MHCYEQDIGKIGYYKREIMIPLGKYWYYNENERGVD